MASNRTASDRIHDNLNPIFRSRENPNWRALVEAIGQSDQDTADLIEEVRKQFFISTASRPYLDRLGANLKINRPKTVGMDDTGLRRYIPILAYQPKQVKLIMDQLLDIFFFRESTSAFVESASSNNYYLKDGWELLYKVDATKEEKIIFLQSEFTDISLAGAEEIAAAINRQALSSFATVSVDKITKQKQIRIFSKTIGAKSSIEITGGRANISLKFLGFIDGAGSGTTTQWHLSKIGDTVTMKYVGGSLVALDRVEAGDIVIVDMPVGYGSFEVQEVDLINNHIVYQNIQGVEDADFNHAASPDYYVRFMKPQRSVVYTKNNRAMVWELASGEIVIEMPATPPIVRRSLIGSAHVNGTVAIMEDRISDTEIQVDDASEWPESGVFILEPVEEIKKLDLQGYESSDFINGRFDSFEKRFYYTGKSGNRLTGISPNFPKASDADEEGVGIAYAGSRIYLNSSVLQTGVLGPYMSDTSSSFVLSGFTGKLNKEINAGNTSINIDIKTPNNIPNEQGFLIFDYGLATQEGPVRYLYKASENNIAIDPAYVFQYNHSVNSSITAIRRKGAQVLSGLGKEYPLYVSDPGAAREVLQDLIRDVKSAGTFLRYIVRFPKTYYSDFNVYE